MAWSFAEAGRIFLDPHRIETYVGAEEAHGEDRWKAIGLVEVVVLTVVYTIRGRDADIIRLISARKADNHERAQ
ncbi:MAG: BrnT family toxin [Pseudomonadota bacterium]|nr:BrnT family toxin [Pseudomonadota bacterium]